MVRSVQQDLKGSERTFFGTNKQKKMFPLYNRYIYIYVATHRHSIRQEPIKCVRRNNEAVFLQRGQRHRLGAAVVVRGGHGGGGGRAAVPAQQRDRRLPRHQRLRRLGLRPRAAAQYRPASLWGGGEGLVSLQPLGLSGWFPSPQLVVDTVGFGIDNHKPSLSIAFHHAKKKQKENSTPMFVWASWKRKILHIVVVQFRGQTDPTMMNVQIYCILVQRS